MAIDIICGFPTETETNSGDTMELSNKYKFYKFTTLNVDFSQQQCRVPRTKGFVC